MKYCDADWDFRLQDKRSLECAEGGDKGIGLRLRLCVCFLEEVFNLPNIRLCVSFCVCRFPQKQLQSFRVTPRPSP